MNLDDLSDVEVLALTIYGEARGESIEGQIAVGCVARNRLIVGEEYKDVCLEDKQFSCWNRDDPNRSVLDELGQKLFNGEDINDPILKQCMWIAEGVMNKELMDITGGAKNYMTTELYHKNIVHWAY